MIFLLQTDNRLTLDYVVLSQKVNKYTCKVFGYTYKFIKLELQSLKQTHPCLNTKYAKIFIIEEFVKTCSDDDILIFLDTDA